MFHVKQRHPATCRAPHQATQATRKRGNGQASIGKFHRKSAFVQHIAQFVGQGSFFTRLRCFT
jgi:hypothetical protein